MILDKIVHAPTYRGLGPLFVEAFDYLASLRQSTPEGRYEIKGDHLYLIIQEYKTSSATERQYESHRLYADILCVLEGEEMIYYAPQDRLTIQQAYDADKDVVRYADDDHLCPVLVEAGSFVIFWPQDGHKPGCSGKRPGRVRKAVFKVRIG